jgi:hypothetical protein
VSSRPRLTLRPRSTALDLIAEFSPLSVENRGDTYSPRDPKCEIIQTDRLPDNPLKGDPSRPDATINEAAPCPTTPTPVASRANFAVALRLPLCPWAIVAKDLQPSLKISDAGRPGFDRWPGPSDRWCAGDLHCPRLECVDRTLPTKSRACRKISSKKIASAPQSQLLIDEPDSISIKRLIESRGRQCERWIDWYEREDRPIGHNEFTA